MGIVLKPVVVFNEDPDYRIIVDGIEVGSVSLDEKKKVWKASRNLESDEPENFKSKENAADHLAKLAGLR